MVPLYKQIQAKRKECCILCTYTSCNVTTNIFRMQQNNLDVMYAIRNLKGYVREKVLNHIGGNFVPMFLTYTEMCCLWTWSSPKCYRC